MQPTSRLLRQPCQQPQRLFLSLAILLTALLSTGCRSAGKHHTEGFASVEIQGNTPGQIRDMAVEVFEKHGYKIAPAAYPNLVLEKQGSALDNAAYGNWTGSPPWIRVKASITPLSETRFTLRCKAVLVRDKGQSAFEEELKLYNFQAGPYQKLLDEVAARLTSPAPAH